MPWRRVMSWGWRVARCMRMPGRLRALRSGIVTSIGSLAGWAQLPENGGWVVGDQRAGAGRERRGHQPRVRALERPDEVDAAMQRPQPPGLDAVSDGVAAKAAPLQLLRR